MSRWRDLMKQVDKVGLLSINISSINWPKAKVLLKSISNRTLAKQ